MSIVTFGVMRLMKAKSLVSTHEALPQLRELSIRLQNWTNPPLSFITDILDAAPHVNWLSLDFTKSGTATNAEPCQLVSLRELFLPSDAPNRYLGSIFTARTLGIVEILTTATLPTSSAFTHVHALRFRPWNK